MVKVTMPECGHVLTLPCYQVRLPPLQAKMRLYNEIANPGRLAMDLGRLPIWLALELVQRLKIVGFLVL